jgi:hypothetical protein
MNGKINQDYSKDHKVKNRLNRAKKEKAGQRTDTALFLSNQVNSVL